MRLFLFATMVEERGSCRVEERGSCRVKERGSCRVKERGMDGHAIVVACVLCRCIS